MFGRSKRRLAWPASLLSLASIAAVVIVSASNADSGSGGPAATVLPLHGKFTSIIQHFGCTSSPVGVCSTFNAAGDIAGSGFVVVDTFPSGEFGFSQAHTVITTNKGNLHCHEAALFVQPDSDGISPFVDICIIDPTGTGIYAGATGVIRESGTFDFTQTPPVGQLDYTGKLKFA